MRQMSPTTLVTQTDMMLNFKLRSSSRASNDIVTTPSGCTPTSIVILQTTMFTYLRINWVTKSSNWAVTKHSSTSSCNKRLHINGASSIIHQKDSPLTTYTGKCLFLGTQIIKKITLLNREEPELRGATNLNLYDMTSWTGT